MIERQNIIKLLGDRTNIYHSALLTTYSFDPIYFEAVYLSTLRKLGITNVVVLMDASMYDQLLSDSNYQCHRVSQYNYTLVRTENYHSGVFHPKVVLFFGEEEGTLIVSSGNLTYSGLANNDEVWNAFHVQGNNSIHYPLFYQAWKYLSQSANQTSSLVSRQIDWMLEQSPWLHQETTDSTALLSSGEECALLYNTAESTILDKLLLSIGDKRIVSIKVIAPFYDAEGDALSALKKQLAPKEMLCILDLERQSAPYSLLKTDTSTVFCKSDSSNPLHAKIFELQAEDETWLLCGSANAGNMALGTGHYAFNDEVCILLHCNTQRNYITELGLKYIALTQEERKSIIKPKQIEKDPNKLQVKFVYCEEQNDELRLQFSKDGIKGELTLLDSHQSIIYQKNIITRQDMSINIADVEIANLNMAVLMNNETEISNRLLVVREVNVERGNPDPKRRKLSRLLDDPDLLENLSHILGYIEFDDAKKMSKRVKSADNTTSDEQEDVAVTSDRFNVLKDSALSISMHSGIRILGYLRQILFKNEEIENTEDDLLEIDDEGSKGDDEKEKDFDHKSSEASDAAKMRNDVVSFLKKMLSFLQEKTKDASIYGDYNKAVNRQCLQAVSGLNAASSTAVAARAIIFMMNKYGQVVRKPAEVRDLFIKCTGYFLSLYSNKLPDADTLRNRKIRELLNDATIDVLSALCFFGYDKQDCLMPQLVLNALELWKGQEEINDLLPLMDSQIERLNPEVLNPKSIDRIRGIAAVYLNGETSIEEFSLWHDKIFMLRRGFGFLIVDNLKRASNGWSYAYHAPWFDDKISSTTGTKFKGYYDL
ncbi:MAG: hypothetical protein ACTTI4_05900 [Prevotella fusca]|uniref:hypothetical protein n=1 Tax=Prevotella fusca TaxID=589436 RepID=UPI003F9F7437